MKRLFSFFLRLFVCFVAAKFLLRAVGWDQQDYLVGLTALLLANVYWFDYLYSKELWIFRRREPESPAAAPPDAPPPPAEAAETSPPSLPPKA